MSSSQSRKLLIGPYFWTLLGVLFFLVIGPWALRFNSATRVALLKVGLTVTLPLLIVGFSLVYAKYKPIKLYRKNSEGDGEFRNRAIKAALSLPYYTFWVATILFPIGAAIISFVLKRSGTLTSFETMLFLLWGIGAGIGTGWTAAVSIQFFTVDFLRELKLQGQEVEFNKGLNQSLLFWVEPGVVLTIFFLILTSIGASRVSLRTALGRSLKDINNTSITSTTNGVGGANKTELVTLVENEFTKSLSTPMLLFALAVLLLASYGPIVAARRLRIVLDDFNKAFDEFKKGNLHQEVPVLTDDELGKLAVSYNEALKIIRGFLEKHREVISTVATTVKQIKTSIAEESSSAAELASTASQISAATDELSQSAEELDNMAREMSEVSKLLREQAEQSGTNIFTVLQHLDKLAGRMEEIADKVMKLEEKSEKIGEVLELIKSISDETHILSINAAIEAASAGEHGRRFAVVASEVRRLAEESREAAKSIADIISEVKAATQDSVFATERGLEIAREAKRKADLAREGLSEILTQIKKENEYSTRLALSTAQIRTSSEQMALSLKELYEAAEKARMSISEIEKAINELVRLAESLEKYEGKFSGV